MGLNEDYFEYNPEEDYNGAKGQEIAERVLRHCGYDFKVFREWIEEQKREQEERDTKKEQMLETISRIGEVLRRKHCQGKKVSLVIPH